MKNARQFVYRYDGDAKSDEVVEDFDGEITVPEKDQVIPRNGRNWRVVAVVTQQTLSNPPAIPVCRVFLAKVD
jgi:hypothetical protein